MSSSPVEPTPSKKGLSRRRFLAYAGAAAVAGGAGLVGWDLLYNRGPPGPKTLTVYDQGATFAGSVQNQLITQFEAKHGVTVVVSTGTADQLVTEFVTQTQNGLPTADVVTVWDPVGASQLLTQDLAVNVVPSSLASKILPQDQSPFLIQHWGILTLAYNPLKLAQAGIKAPAAFEDLGDPVYASRLSLVDPTVDASALSLLSYWTHTLDLGWGFVQDLKTNQASITPSWGPPNGPPDYMVASSSPLAVGDAGFGRVYPLQTSGQPITAVIPSEGVLGSPQVVVVSKATEQQALAEAYIEEVIFNQQLLDWWVTQHDLPVSTTDTSLPPGIPSREAIQDVDYAWTFQNELSLQLQWEQIFG
ncbi:MAG: extracellular solute-binding protein [Nitrososphaerales archaeon]|jgi:ABC-type Fe3+ transport system substrate-binding protein